MGNQYLTFTLADTIYAVNVFQVREVLSYTRPQPLPNPDPVVEGLIRSRNQSISVINLRRRFGLGDREPDAAARIIVLEIRNGEEGTENVFGAVADGVNEVLDLETIGCEETPELGNSPAAAFIAGIGRQNDRFILILDVERIFSFSEMASIAAAEGETDAQAADGAEPEVQEAGDSAQDVAAAAAAAEEEPAAFTDPGDGEEASGDGTQQTAEPVSPQAQDGADPDDPDFGTENFEDFEEL